VALFGSGFGSTQGASSVTFNGVPVRYVSWTDTFLFFAVPAGATTGNLVVTVGGIAVVAGQFVVSPLYENDLKGIPSPCPGAWQTVILANCDQVNNSS
jgi:hypothetical protein